MTTSVSDVRRFTADRQALAKAAELATQQVDRDKIPRDPIAGRIDEARRMVNRVLIELDGQRQHAR